MAKSLWTPDQSHLYVCVEHPIPDLFSVIITFILLGSIYTKFCSMDIRICACSATRALVRSGTDFGQGGLGHM